MTDHTIDDLTNAQAELVAVLGEAYDRYRDPQIDRRRCAVCGGFNPGDPSHMRCM